MEISEYVLLGLVVVTGVYLVTIYNNLVRLKHTVTKNWSNIDVLLKQRHDELPNLVETCKGYMKHERDTLEAVMKARSAVASARQAGNVAALGPAESALRMGLGSLFAVAEAYGFYPARADTSEKAHLGPGGVSWQSEGSTARSLNVRRSG